MQELETQRKKLSVQENKTWTIPQRHQGEEEKPSAVGALIEKEVVISSSGLESSCL